MTTRFFVSFENHITEFCTRVQVNGVWFFFVSKSSFFFSPSILCLFTHLRVFTSGLYSAAPWRDDALAWTTRKTKQNNKQLHNNKYQNNFNSNVMKLKENEEWKWCKNYKSFNTVTCVVTMHLVLFSLHQGQQITYLKG